ncbi:MAG: hypothetical protein OXU69_03310 [Gemmatimonadota bacterium]|nr:hypothetical protein [Gemmatimonadota bacterium]
MHAVEHTVRRKIKSWFAMMMHLKADRKRSVAVEFRRVVQR